MSARVEPIAGGPNGRSRRAVDSHGRESLEVPAVPGGRVVLVGAGPGDPELMTVRALRFVRTAGVLVHDRLIPRAVLGLAPPACERIDVGKSPGRAPVPQPAIERILVRAARRGRLVVRLKGGDPFVFGRGGEEVEACRGAGIPCEVVPGVSSVIAAPAVSGIPLTHRELASGFRVISGCGAAGAPIDPGPLRDDETLVIVMAVGRLGDIAVRLLASGTDPGVPAAIVESATLPKERVLRTTLGRLASDAAHAGVRPPAVVIVGKVARVAAALPAERRTG